MSLSNYVFQLQHKHVSSTFQHRRDPVKPCELRIWQQSDVHIQCETHVSIVTNPIIELINTYVMWKNNPHYEKILGDNSTHETPINSYESYRERREVFWTKMKQIQQPKSLKLLDIKGGGRER